MNLDVGSVLISVKDVPPTVGVVTFPVGSISSIQESTIKSNNVLMAATFLNKGSYAVYRPIKVSNAVILDAVRFCFTKYSGVKYDPIRISWFKKIYSNEYSEMLYWYLCRINSEFEYFLRNINPKKVSIKELEQFIIKSNWFERVVK